MKTINILLLLLISLHYNTLAQGILQEIDGSTIEAKIKETEAKRVEHHVAIALSSKNSAKLPIEVQEEEQNKSRIAYGEMLGLGGFLSSNSEPSTFAVNCAVLTISKHIELDKLKESVRIPHGLVLGVGSKKHQFELGIMGVFVGRIVEGNLFSLLAKRGKKSSYKLSPQFGYRLQASNGFSFRVNMSMIYSEEAKTLNYYSSPYTLNDTSSNKSKVSPWCGIAMSYAF